MRTTTLLRTLCIAVAVCCVSSGSLRAQKSPDPDIAYVFPPGGKRGTTVDVRLGGVDWTPDMQFFVLDSRAELVIDGPLGRMLLPEPPALIGPKAYNPPPLPREVTARFVIPNDFPPGPLRWQVANANGTSRTGIFIVGDGPERLENEDRRSPQPLDALPVTVSGRLRRNEEVDSYRFRADRSGPITCELYMRRIGVPLNGVIEIRDAAGRLIIDEVDSVGHDPRVTFAAQANNEYTINVRDLDFRGNRSFVYRLAVTRGPRVLAAIPLAGRRGETRSVEFVGIGLAGGKAKLESVTRTVTFPDINDDTFEYRLKTDSGTAGPFRLQISDLPESIEPAATTKTPTLLQLPAAVTGVLDERNGSDRYRFKTKKGQVWELGVRAAPLGPPLDVTLALFDSAGKQLATNDDLPGTTDAGLLWTAAEDGAYDVVVGDVSGQSGMRAAVYRLVVQEPKADFSLEVPQRFQIQIGQTAELTIKVKRHGNHKHPIRIALDSLPAGISHPDKMVIAAGASELKIKLAVAADASSTASLVTVRGISDIGGKTVTHIARAQASGNLAPRSFADNAVTRILVAVTMKPRTRIRPIESDERTVHRGSTHPAEIGVERLEGFDGDVVIQMESKQPAKFRQGLAGPDVILPRGQDRLFYPCFLPEGAETLDAYRFSMVAVAKVADPKGNVRYLLSKMNPSTSVGITAEGALLKISHPQGPIKVQHDRAQSGKPFDVRITLLRSAKLTAPIRLELDVPKELQKIFSAEPLDVPPGQSELSFRINTNSSAKPSGRYTLTIRATALKRSQVPKLDESAGCTPLSRQMLDLLKAGYLPVISETRVVVEF